MRRHPWLDDRRTARRKASASTFGRALPPSIGGGTSSGGASAEIPPIRSPPRPRSDRCLRLPAYRAWRRRSRRRPESQTSTPLRSPSRVPSPRLRRRIELGAVVPLEGVRGAHCALPDEVWTCATVKVILCSAIPPWSSGRGSGSSPQEDDAFHPRLDENGSAPVRPVRGGPNRF